MPHPRIAPARRAVPRPEPATPRSGRRFADALPAPAPASPDLGDVLEASARSLSARQDFVDRAIRRARRGGLQPGDLLALQAGVYRWAEEVQLASKLVNEATQGVKTVLRSQS
ncbi:MAG: hypothetical protein AAF447_15985 [Myxococcota bacterium]